jgi:septum formation topological specificity factor MinE
MFDTLPFPNTTAKDAEERSKQTIDYLLQLREELIFILENIVSGDYWKLSTQTTTQQAIETVITRSETSLTVAEVVNSTAFRNAINALKKEIPKEYLVSAEQTQVSNEPNGINIYSVKDSSGEVHQLQVKNGKSVALSVNYDTGNLEYTTI